MTSYEKKLQKTAEKKAIQDFNQTTQHHEFSPDYQDKKARFLDDITPSKKITWSKQKIVLAAIITLFLIPPTAYAAKEIYQWFIKKDNYQLNLSVKENKHYEHNKYYKLKLNYLPKDMISDSNSNKYSFSKTPNQGGLSFRLWQISKEANMTQLFTEEYQKKTVGKHDALIVKIATIDASNPESFDTIAYLLFEKEGYILQTYIGNDVPENEWEKVLSNTSLEETTKENATSVGSFDEIAIQEKGDTLDPGYLPTDSSQLYKIGDSIKLSPHDGISINFTVTNMTVLNNISDFDSTNFNSLMFDTLKEKKLLNEDGSFNPVTQKIIKPGNGSTTIDQVIDTRQSDIKFIYLTATIENLKKATIQDLYFQNGPILLEKEKKGWRMFDENVDFSTVTGEVDYLDSHGKGEKNFYQMPEFKPKEKRVIHFGYFVNDYQLDKLFLPVFIYSGFDQLDSKSLQLIDIRQ